MLRLIFRPGPRLTSCTFSGEIVVVFRVYKAVFQQVFYNIRQPLNMSTISIENLEDKKVNVDES